MKPFNVNHYIKVKLTELGYIHLANEHNKFASQLKDIPKRTAAYYKEQADPDGYTKFQMWSFMEQMGGSSGMGMPQLYDTNILIDIEDEMGSALNLGEIRRYDKLEEHIERYYNDRYVVLHDSEYSYFNVGYESDEIGELIPVSTTIHIFNNKLDMNQFLDILNLVDDYTKVYDHGKFNSEIVYKLRG